MFSTSRLNIAVLFSMCLWILGCGDQTEPVDQAEDSKILLDEVSAAVGIDFTHYNGMTGQLLFPEVMGSGLALFDFDRDGDLDLYLVQGNRLDATIPYSSSIYPPRDSIQVIDQLYKNLLIETGKLNFENVTDASGIYSEGYGMGAIVGDVNNDSLPDIFVTNYGPDALFINQGNGKFTKEDSGFNIPGWSTTANFLHLNEDGLLDLYVGQYSVYEVGENNECRDSSNRHDYCGPYSYLPAKDRFYINAGNGKFERADELFQTPNSDGPALGSISLLEKGQVELIVANDRYANHHWKNKSGSSYSDQAVLSGTAVNQYGDMESSMGISLGDFDEDGDEDLWLTHYKNETNTLYKRDSNGNFFDETDAENLAISSRSKTGFGTAFVDLNSNGYLDLFIANGSVGKEWEAHDQGHPYPLTETNQIYLRGAEGFKELNDDLAILRSKRVSRGLATGDIDNDGDLDLIVSNNSGLVEIHLNQTSFKNWLGFKLLNESGSYDLGSQVKITLPSGRSLLRSTRRDGSYLSSSDPRVYFGLGTEKEIQSAQITWSNGSVKELTLENLKMRDYNTVRQDSK